MTKKPTYRPKNKAEKYAVDVISGKIKAAKTVQLACKRYFSDLKTGKKRGLEFRPKHAELAIKFMSLAEHNKGDFKGQSFILEPWQEFILWNIFGWYRKDGSRRFRDVYIEVPRKNGKTFLAAVVGLKGLIADFEAGSEVYVAATTRAQANICYKEAELISQKSRGLRISGKPAIKKFQYSLIYDDNCKMTALAADADTLDGLNPHIAIIDEYHAHKTSFLYDVLKSGMGNRKNPLQFTITTAGFNKNGPCYTMRKYCQDVLEGKVQDDSLFGVIYTLDNGDDWRDPKAWTKANPNMNVSVNMDFLKDELKKALASPASEVNFKTKYLNLWTDSSQTWIPDHAWMKGQKEIDFALIAGRECYGGLDLASTSDICALTLLFPVEDYFICLYQFWLPEDTIADRSERNFHGYANWSHQGHITATPGNVVDYEYIRNAINELSAQYKIKSIAYDRWNSTDLVVNLLEDGVKMNPFNQSVTSMSAPTKEFEKLVLTQKIQHGKNPVMRWMMGNILMKIDANGNLKINKEKSSDKVDGPVSNVMALGEYMTFKEKAVATQSVYNKRGIREL